ncbi:MAG: alpha/beta hydrolase [Caulobacter sp.]|nr:alpha/beta hydrolase [Caulobacter sp.]
MTVPASPFPSARRRDIAVPRGTVAGYEFGPADRPLDILFLHANGFNAGAYADILTPVGEQLRVLAVDQRGHGRTTLQADPEAHEAWLVFRDDLLVLLEAMGETPTVLAGHSMGGTVGLLAAAERTDAARRLVLFDPVVMTAERLAAVGPEGLQTSPLAVGARRRRATFPDREAAFQAYSGRGAFRTWPDAALRGYLADGLLEGDDGQVHLSCRPQWEAANFTAHHHDTVGAFARVTAPIRVLKAEIGSTCGLEADEITALTHGRARTDVIAGTSHFLPMERPDLVRAALSEAAST